MARVTTLIALAFAASSTDAMVPCVRPHSLARMTHGPHTSPSDRQGFHRGKLSKARRFPPRSPRTLDSCDSPGSAAIKGAAFVLSSPTTGPHDAPCWMPGAAGEAASNASSTALPHAAPTPHLARPTERGGGLHPAAHPRMHCLAEPSGRTTEATGAWCKMCGADPSRGACFTRGGHNKGACASEAPSSFCRCRCATRDDRAWRLRKHAPARSDLFSIDPFQSGQRMPDHEKNAMCSDADHPCSQGGQAREGGYPGMNNQNARGSLADGAMADCAVQTGASHRGGSEYVHGRCASGGKSRMLQMIDASALLLASSTGRWAGVLFLPLLVHASLCPVGGQYCACTVCPSGQFSTAATSFTGTLTCTQCPAGKFARSAGQSSCISCAAGQVSKVGSSTCIGNANCTGGESTNKASSATGGSQNLPPYQCHAWIKMYDDTHGASWTKCKDARTDPCSCAGSSGTSFTCSADGTAITRM